MILRVGRTYVVNLKQQTVLCIGEGEFGRSCLLWKTLWKCFLQESYSEFILGKSRCNYLHVRRALKSPGSVKSEFAVFDLNLQSRIESHVSHSTPWFI